jgi:hypothetical protein
MGRVYLCIVHCVFDVVAEAVVTKLVTLQSDPDQPIAKLFSEPRAELEAEWELGTFATDKYRSSLTTSRNHYAA